MRTFKKKLRTVDIGLALRLLVLLAVAVVVDGVSEVDAADEDVFNDTVKQGHEDKGGVPASPKVTPRWLDDVDLLSMFAPVSDAVETPECRSHSRRFLKGVGAGEPWAIKMLDASSKLPAGALVGNLLLLGNYDECLSIRGVATEVGVVSGRHCLVALGDAYFSSVNVVDRLTGIPRLRNMAERAETLAGNATAFLREFGATVSLCVPSSCTSRDVERHLRTELRTRLNVTVSVSDLGCSSREDEEGYSWLDYFAILVVLVLLTVAGCSTYYELTQGHSASYNALLGSFSLRTNTRSLLNTQPPSSDVSLAVLDGLRVLNSLFVFAVHCSTLKVFVTACGNIADNEKGMYELKNMPFTTSVPVDSFLLLSGLLVSYNFFKDRDNGLEFSLTRFYIHRLVRVTPCYAMVVLFSSTILTHLGDGPLWKTNMVPLRDGCRDEWLYGLLYVYNYYPAAKSVMHMRCLGESWYLSVDMQLFWLAPLVLYPLWRWPRLGKCLIAALIAAGLFIAFAEPYIHEYRYTLAPVDRAYVTTHTRYTPWLVGAALGYVLHTTKRTPPGLSHGTLAVGHLLSALIMLAALFAPYHFLREDYVYGRTSTALFYCLLRPGWALGLAWVIFTAARGYNSLVYSVLSWPRFQVPSRLTFALYLTQLVVLRVVYLTARVPYHVTGLTAIIDNLGIGGIALTVSYLLHILVETPLCKLEQILWKKRVAKVNKKAD